MNGSRNSLLAALLLLVALFCGCGGIKTVEDALVAIDKRPSNTAKPEEFLLRLDDATRLKLGLELFLADSPTRGHVGIRLLASTSIPEQTWQTIEAKAALPHLARRYSILSAKVRRVESVATIISLMHSSSQDDFVVHASVLLQFTGLIFGTAKSDQKLVAARWARHLQRERDGLSQEISNALAASYIAGDADTALRAFRRVPIDSLGLVAEDILDLTDNVYSEVGREAALLLGGSSDDAGARLLVVLLSSDDYLTRYNAYNSLVKRTGIRFDYDPAASFEARKRAIKSARRTLGILE